MTSKHIPVQLRFLPDTVEEVKLLAHLLNNKNLTDVVGRCVHIAGIIVKAMNNGCRMQLVHPNGSVEYLIIPGINDSKTILR